MRILVCGDRNWKDREVIHNILRGWGHSTEIVSGMARGADSIAAEWAEDHEVLLLPFPAEWEHYGKAAGPKRNQQMLTEGKPHVVLAFHDNLEASKGTKDMVQRAKFAGIPVYLISHG